MRFENATSNQQHATFKISLDKQKFLQKADSLQVAKFQDLLEDCNLQRLPSYTSLLKKSTKRHKISKASQK